MANKVRRRFGLSEAFGGAKVRSTLRFAGALPRAPSDINPMIPRYRNRALKQLGLSFLLLVLMFVFVGMGAYVPKVVIAVSCIILGTFSFYFYGVGSVTLAKAKGYDDTVVLAIIIVSFLCLSGLLYTIPLIILFGLKDRTKPRRHSHAREPEIARRNPPAKLPPLRE